MYRNLIKNGWTLSEIDEMDILFYLDLYSEPGDEQQVYIDQLF